MKKILRNFSGFSLIQVMIAVGMLGGVALMVAKLGSDQSKLSKTARTSFDTNELYARFQRFLLNSEICNNSFSGMVVPPNGEISVFEIRRGTNTLLTSIAPKNQIGEISIKSMQLSRKDVPDPSIVKLIVEIEKVHKETVLGGSTVKREIELDVNIEPFTNKILGCYSHLDNAVNTARELACKDICSTCWDSATKKCNLNGVSIYEDSLDQTLKTSPTPKYSYQNYNCSQCKNECNACPAGSVEISRNCSLGKNCGFHKWRNCTSNCRRIDGFNPPVGVLIPR